MNPKWDIFLSDVGSEAAMVASTFSVGSLIVDLVLRFKVKYSLSTSPQDRQYFTLSPNPPLGKGKTPPLLGKGKIPPLLGKGRIPPLPPLPPAIEFPSSCFSSLLAHVF